MAGELKEKKEGVTNVGTADEKTHQLETTDPEKINLTCQKELFFDKLKDKVGKLIDQFPDKSTVHFFGTYAVTTETII